MRAASTTPNRSLKSTSLTLKMRVSSCLSRAPTFSRTSVKTISLTVTSVTRRTSPSGARSILISLPSICATTIRSCCRWRQAPKPLNRRQTAINLRLRHPPRSPHPKQKRNQKLSPPPPRQVQKRASPWRRKRKSPHPRTPPPSINGAPPPQPVRPRPASKEAERHEPETGRPDRSSRHRQRQHACSGRRRQRRSPALSRPRRG